MEKHCTSSLSQSAVYIEPAICYGGRGKLDAGGGEGEGGGEGGGWKVGEAKCLEEGRVRIPSLQVYLLSSSTYIKKASLSRK